MYSVPICGPPAAAGDVHALTRWTLPISPEMRGQVYVCVFDAYSEWQAAPHQAALLAELASGYAHDVTDPCAHLCVAVTAKIEGRRATVSAIPAVNLEPDHHDVLTPPPGYAESSEGSTHMATGLCKYAAVNLVRAAS
ncbi:hypothetical protein AB0D11_47355 [Streptomyces monashensis]|uniref:hypothetical protein n=1 Tax=Streptomyces monashensis TaxID=1678012 RepID=UPI0033F17B85